MFFLYGENLRIINMFSLISNCENKNLKKIGQKHFIVFLSQKHFYVKIKNNFTYSDYMVI